MSQETTANVRLVLDDDLTMRTVDHVRATLQAAIGPPSGAGSTDVVPLLTAPSRIAIDCSAAATIDLTFIQLLVAARVSARTAGRRISLASCPDGVMLDTLTRGGFRVVPDDDGGFWFTGDAA